MLIYGFIQEKRINSADLFERIALTYIRLFFSFMLQLVFDAYPFRHRENSGKKEIFDSLRKKWVRLTPEEWVRQNWVQWMVQTMGYPPEMIGVEKQIQLGELNKRFDLLVYNQRHQPWLLIECKSMDVSLNKEVLDQLLRYHLELPAHYLLISNGTHSYLWKKEPGGLKEMDQMPAWGSD